MKVEGGVGRVSEPARWQDEAKVGYQKEVGVGRRRGEVFKDEGGYFLFSSKNQNCLLGTFFTLGRSGD